ncbi:MAG: hypothetical protein ACREMG_12500, partial [Gemmatimonadales bacterium]
CWPTWDRLGLVSNFEATLQYMAALDVDEGVRCWQRELLSPSAGEVTFIGPVGNALTPVQAKGFPAIRELPEFAAVYPKIFHLGEVTRYRPGERMVARVVLDSAWAPAITDFRVSGEPALPVSILLENAVWSAQWTTPRRWSTPRLVHIEDLTVHLPALRLHDSGIELERVDAGSYRADGRWEVDVRYRRPTPRGWDPVAQLRLVYDRTEESDEQRTPPLTPVLPPSGEPGRPCPPGLYWPGLVLRVTAWRGSWRAAVTATVDEPGPDDLWLLPLPPQTRLPVAALENILRALVAGSLAPTPADRLFVRRVTLHGHLHIGTNRIDGVPREGRWRVTDSDADRPVLTVLGPRLGRWPDQDRHQDRQA